MRKLIPIALLLASATHSPVFAQTLEPMIPLGENMPQDSRIKLLPYDETDVYTITAKPGYQTNIVFGRGEEIHTISVGDRSFWQIIPAGNRMFIRPLNEDVATNMTVITNRRSYQFDLKSIPPDEKEGNIYVAKFVYPDKKAKPQPVPAPSMAIATPPSTLSPAPAASPAQPPFQMQPDTPPAMTAGSIRPPYTPPPCVPPECIPPGATQPIDKGSAPPYIATMSGPGITHPVGPNFNYTYSGPDDLAPLQVYDDGKSTYIRYRNSNEPLPNIYLVDHQGKERPTTYYLKGGAMVVDNVVSKMALKSSSGTVYIYNELLSPQ